MKSPQSFLSLSLSLLLANIAGSCAPEEDTPSKRVVAIEQRKSDSIDHCAVFDWYGDGECDSFCLAPDPDCGVECPRATDATVHYMSHDVAECAASLFNCSHGETRFDDECGCGCIGERECPDSSQPEVWYVSYDVTECSASLFACDDGQLRFDDECGCGCIGEDSE